VSGSESAGEERLIRDAETLGVSLSGRDATRLLTLVDELMRWNRTYNLTAIKTRAAALTHHLLDSLAVNSALSGTRIADVGTGAGFPGLPLALVNPARQFTLIDSVAKKLRFVAHAVERLGLENVKPLYARVESMPVAVPFDIVVARAVAPLPKLLAAVARICGPQTEVLAMKGKWPQAELAALPAGWRVVRSQQLLVPGVDAERCLIVLKRAL
jgi:16S rRNA (guanine527-N7)-methyltransferase